MLMIGLVIGWQSLEHLFCGQGILRVDVIDLHLLIQLIDEAHKSLQRGLTFLSFLVGVS